MPVEPKKPQRVPLAECKHCDIERVGAFEVVCYQCGHVADWRELMAGNKDAWKPL
jgi:hypothetical protein